MPKTTNAEKRHARYLADLAKHTPEQLAERERSYHEPSPAPPRAPSRAPPYAPSHAPSHASTVHAVTNELRIAKGWFLEFMATIHTDIGVSALYFTPGAPEPDIALLKEYAKYLMQSRLGQRVNVWNLKTLQHHMRMLFAVLQSACNHPIHTIFAICIELNNFVRRSLVESQRTIAAVEQRSTP